MESTFVILFSIASAVAIAVRRTRVPYTVALVVVGLLVGALNVVEPPHLTKELLFALFLPGLVFEAAYNIHIRELRASWRTITALSVPGVVAAIGVTGAMMIGLFRAFDVAPELSWRYAMVFAALIAATDPIAVVSLFRRLGVSPALTTTIEAESLFNDGTSIVVLSLVLAFVTGEASSVGALALRFLMVIGGGAAIGLALAFVISHVTKRLDDPMIEITLTTIAAYGSFVAAERLHLSGVIATVAAGLLLGSYGREIGMSTSTRGSVDVFWEYVAFALNSIVFLLIGFEVRPVELLATVGPIGIAFVSVVAARLVVVFVVRGAFALTTERISAKTALILTWGGLRGALSMVLALALPSDFPNRALLIDMTFGVVLISLLLQGLTMQTVVTRLRVE